MSNKPLYKTIRAEDLIKYHQGILSPAEMNAIEKAALDDDFVADALEGFGKTNEGYESHFERLKTRLNEKTFHKQKDNRAKQWLRVAAAFIGVAAMGYGSYLMMNKNNSPSLAKAETIRNQPSPSEPLPEIATIQAPQEAAPVADNHIADVNPKKAKSQAPPLVAPAQKRLIKQEEVAAATTSEVDTKKIVAKAARAQAKSNDEAPTAQGIRKIRQENFKLEEEMSVTQYTDSTTCSIVHSKKLAEDNLNLTLNQIEKKNAALGFEPIKGWGKFNQYIYRNTMAANATNATKPTIDTISIQFNINKKGRPEGIIVLRSTNNSLSEKAAELIKNGPRWKSKSKNEPLKIVIPFVTNIK